MGAGSGDKKGDGHAVTEKGGHGSVDHPLPPGQHEIPSYAGKNMAHADKKGEPFWHPAPRDLPEAPIHFQKNVVRLELHLGDPRQRLEKSGMTDSERSWRKKFVHDQILAPEEPVYVPEFHGNFNPIRRFYRLPWDTFERRVLIPALGYNKGHYTRVMVPKLMIFGGVFLWLYYHFKYHQPSWWDYKKTEVMFLERPYLTEHEIREKMPGVMEKGLRHYEKKQDWRDFDFKSRWTHLKLDPPLRP